MRGCVCVYLYMDVCMCLSKHMFNTTLDNKSHTHVIACASVLYCLQSIYSTCGAMTFVWTSTVHVHAVPWPLCGLEACLLQVGWPCRAPCHLRSTPLLSRRATTSCQWTQAPTKPWPTPLSLPALQVSITSALWCGKPACTAQAALKVIAADSLIRLAGPRPFRAVIKGGVFRSSLSGSA